MSTETVMEDAEELASWRQVHQTLIESVLAARQAVAAQRTQKRFWLEELAANLDDDGHLVSTSVWHRPSAVKKPTVVKRTSALKPTPIKRKKSSPDSKASSAKKPRKQKEDDDTSTGGGGEPKRIKIKLPPKNPPNEELSATHSADDYDSMPHAPPDYHRYSPSAEYGQPWGGPRAAPNLQMMAAVAFANPGAYPPPHGMPPHGQYAYYPPPSAAPVPRGNVTYSSIQDVESDEESDQDAF